MNTGISRGRSMAGPGRAVVNYGTSKYSPYSCLRKSAGDLKPLFYKWDRLLRQAALRLSKGSAPDHPFWYGERTNIGWIALAAHDLRWLPVHEPSITRIKRVRYRGKTRTKKISGRSDLWLTRSNGPKTVFYDCEAKESDLSLSRFIKSEPTYDIPHRVIKDLKQACADLRNKHKEIKGDVGIAMTFLRLYMLSNTSPSNQIMALHNFKRFASNGFGLNRCDFVALHFAQPLFVQKVAKAYKDCYLDFGLAIIGIRLVL